MMCLFKHHIFHLHQTNLSCTLIFIQLHGDIFDIRLGLWNNHMLKGINSSTL